MFKNPPRFIAASAAVALCLSGCSSGQLNTRQSCALLYELALERSMEEKWALAYMGILAQNSQPAIEAMKTAISISREVSEQTGNGQLRAALRSEASSYQNFIDLIAGRPLEDPTLVTDVEAAMAGLDDQYADYVQTTCSGATDDPETGIF